MSRESGDQPTQRTVAELLAQYGGKPAGGPRRRHRRPDDDAESEASSAAPESGSASGSGSSSEPDIATTAPQAIIARIQAENPGAKRTPVRRNGSSHSAGERNGSHGPPEVTRRAPTQPPTWQGKPALGAPAGQPPAGPPKPPPPSATGKAPVVPPVEPVRPGPVEEHRPGLAERLAGLSGGTVSPPPAQRRGPRIPESPTDTFAAVEGSPAPARDVEDLDERAYGARGGVAPADVPGEGEDDLGHGPGYDEDFDDYEDDDRSVGQQWLAMAGQLALGVVGGAVVWLVFNWLWAEAAAAALIAAVVVIVGLVWIVRKMRRTEDLQTMVAAVLVGLVVTVSPAALLLLSR